jgi:ABC-2 type transport system permease protein
MGTTAASIGCVGSAFMAKTRLYEGKDNEALLSMPIPTWMLLFTRALSLYLFTALFTSIAFIPACVRYFTLFGVTFPSIVCCIVITLALPLGVLAIAGLVGWLIALLTARSSRKNLLTTVFLLAFLLVYSLLYSRVQDLLNYAATHGAEVGEMLKNGLYPFWKLGVGATGDFVATLIFVLLILGVFAIVYATLGATYLYILTERRTGKRVKYKEKQSRTRSPFWALLGKEGMRYLKNPMLTFNCCIGSVLCFVAVGYALFDTQLRELILQAPIAKLDVTMIVFVIMLFVASSNMITASSISLEGENLWVLRAMPVSSAHILAVKIAFHTLVTAVPAVIAFSALGVMFSLPAWQIALCVITLALASFLFATVGLVINLKFPNLKWTNEVVVVKQSISSLIAMFGGWGISALVLGGYFWFGSAIGVWYFPVILGVFALASAALIVWTKTRGVEIFETLS